MRKNLFVMVFVLLGLGYVGAGMVFAAANTTDYRYELENVINPANVDDPDHEVTGAQWFVTLKDNINNNSNVLWNDGTAGGAASGDIFQVGANLISDFNPVNAVRHPYLTNSTTSTDIYGIKSAYLVMAEPTSLDVRFFNYTGRPAYMDVLPITPEHNSSVVSPDIHNLPMSKNNEDFLDTKLSFKTKYNYDWSQDYGYDFYGSTLGALYFRQSQDTYLLHTISNEGIQIPLVVAQVKNGPAMGKDLIFDMTVLDENDVVTRKQFDWKYDHEKNSRYITRDLGTFFMFRAPTSNQYNLIPRVTNRTGTRYYFHRYDETVAPSSWSYDFADYPRDLPPSFQLAQQSQIAPGLVTTYPETTLDVTYLSDNSFRLYPFSTIDVATELTLKFSKVRADALYGEASYFTTRLDNPSPWTVSAFNIQSTLDTESPYVPNYSNTSARIASLAGGKYAVMPNLGVNRYTFTGAQVQPHNFGMQAFERNSFMIDAAVPGNIIAPDNVPFLPMRVRMRISRFDLPETWRTALMYENNRVLAQNLSDICKIWVYSPIPDDKVINILKEITDGRESLENFVQAFTYGDYLYVDFMVLMANAKSTKPRESAFLEFIKHDTINYLYIGDGAVDDNWTLGFFVTGTSVQEPVVYPSGDGDSGDSGGGGCNAGGLGMAAMLMCMALYAGFKPLKKTR